MVYSMQSPYKLQPWCLCSTNSDSACLYAIGIFNEACCSIHIYTQCPMCIWTVHTHTHIHIKFILPILYVRSYIYVLLNKAIGSGHLLFSAAYKFARCSACRTSSLLYPHKHNTSASAFIIVFYNKYKHAVGETV